MIENGKRGITVKTLFTLAQALEVSPVQIMKFLEDAMKNDRLPDEILQSLLIKKVGRPKKQKE